MRSPTSEPASLARIVTVGLASPILAVIVAIPLGVLGAAGWLVVLAWMAAGAVLLGSYARVNLSEAADMGLLVMSAVAAYVSSVAVVWLLLSG